MATFTSTGRGKADPKEQFKDALGEETEVSQEFPKVLEDAEPPKEGERVQVSPRVREVTCQHRPQKEQRPLLRKLHQIQTPSTQNQVQVRKPPRPQLRFPPKTPPRPPPRPPPRTPTRKLHQFLLSMLKLTKRQAKFGQIQ